MRFSLLTILCCAVPVFVTGVQVLHDEGDSQERPPIALSVTSAGTMIRRHDSHASARVGVAQGAKIGLSGDSGLDSNYGGAPVFSDCDAAEPSGDSDEESINPTGGDPCTESYTIDGDWCEQTCAKSSDPLPAASGLLPGNCPDKQYKFAKGTVKTKFFGKTEGVLPESGSSIDSFVSTCCLIHHVIKHKKNAEDEEKLCESFCVSKLETHYAETRTGVVKGSCADSGFPKFLGHGKLNFYVEALSNDE